MAAYLMFKTKNPQPKLRILLLFLCRYRKCRRLSRMVQDGLFFSPKAYTGTPSGRKKTEAIRKRDETRRFISFLFLKSIKFSLCISTVNDSFHSTLIAVPVPLSEV